MLAPAERVSPEAAIRAVIRSAAWLCHAGYEIGSLKPGKPADVVVLEDDPRRVKPTSITDIKVSAARMDGKQVYASAP